MGRYHCAGADRRTLDDHRHVLPIHRPPTPARRTTATPSIADGAGELGFFSPHSWWPILIALSFSVAAVGAALWLPKWLIAAGIVMVLGAVSGLVFEYYVGPEKH